MPYKTFFSAFVSHVPGYTAVHTHTHTITTLRPWPFTLRLHIFGMPIKATLFCSPNIANSAKTCWAHGIFQLPHLNRLYTHYPQPRTTLHQLILLLPLLLERSWRCRTVLSYQQRLSSSTSFPRFDPTILLKTRCFRPGDARGFRFQCDN